MKLQMPLLLLVLAISGVYALGGRNHVRKKRCVVLLPKAISEKSQNKSSCNKYLFFHSCFLVYGVIHYFSIGSRTVITACSIT